MRPYSEREYRLAEKIIHLEDALNTANGVLNRHKLLGVLPNDSVSFKESSAFYKRVREMLKKII